MAMPAEQRQQFLPPGKWVGGHGGYFCIPNENSIPSPKLIAAEFASNFSTGDGRWSGSCEAKNYKIINKYEFSVELQCSQIRASNGSAIKFKPAYVKGRLSKAKEYIVTQKTAAYSDAYDTMEIIYKRVSTVCTKQEGYNFIVGRHKNIDASILNPDLQFLIGLPGEAEYYSTSPKY
jgi:hypothetical protein